MRLSDFAIQGGWGQPARMVGAEVLLLARPRFTGDLLRLPLAVINCQGEHYYRRFFSKRHELTHRLVDGEQLMLAFRQTLADRKDPGDALVDKVAGELAFFPDIIAPQAEQYLDRYGLTFRGG